MLFFYIVFLLFENNYVLFNDLTGAAKEIFMLAANLLLLCRFRYLTDAGEPLIKSGCNRGCPGK